MSDSHSATTFLEGLGADSRELLLSLARPVSFLRGSVLVRHGDPARGAYVLREGTVEAVVAVPGGETLTVARLGPGAIFGEMALIELGTCTATVRATSNVDGWFLGHEDFRALAAHCTPAAIGLQHAITLVLASRIAALNAELLEHPASEDRPARPVAAGDPLRDLPRLQRPPFDAAAFLSRLPIFQRFSADEIDEVASHGAYLDVARGAQVFGAGGAAAAAFLVVRGAVEVVGARDGRERRIAMLGPGQLLGYLSVLRHAAHSSNAFAREDSLLLEFPAAPFRQLYFGTSRASTRLRGAVHASLLASLARSNRAVTRLISQARLEKAHDEEQKLEAAYGAQLAAAS